MICARCRHAADRQLGPEQHCDDPGGPGARCDCQHRTDRYQPRPDTEDTEEQRPVGE